MKVIILSRMWDKNSRGHETVERVSTHAKSILEYARKMSCIRADKMLLSYNLVLHNKEKDDSIAASSWDDAKRLIDSYAADDCLEQWFLRVMQCPSPFDEDPELYEPEYVLYRIQLRNIH